MVFQATISVSRSRARIHFAANPGRHPDAANVGSRDSRSSQGALDPGHVRPTAMILGGLNARAVLISGTPLAAVDRDSSPFFVRLAVSTWDPRTSTRWCVATGDVLPRIANIEVLRVHVEAARRSRHTLHAAAAGLVRSFEALGRDADPVAASRAPRSRRVRHSPCRAAGSRSPRLRWSTATSPRPCRSTR